MRREGPSETLVHPSLGTVMLWLSVTAVRVQLHFLPIHFSGCSFTCSDNQNPPKAFLAKVGEPSPLESTFARNF